MYLLAKHQGSLPITASLFILLAFGCNGARHQIPESLRERAIEQCRVALGRALPLDEGARLSLPKVARVGGAGSYSVRAGLEGAQGWRYVECRMTEQRGELEISDLSLVEW